MPDLFTPAELQQIRDGHRDTMDSYNKTNITVRVTDDIVMSRVQENRKKDYTDYVLPAQIQYGRTKNKEDVNFAGTWNNLDVICFVHIDYVDAANLLTNDFPDIPMDTSKLIIDNDGGVETYRVAHVSVEGAREKRQTYMVIGGEREEQPAL